MFKKTLFSILTLFINLFIIAQECSEITISVILDGFPQEASWDIIDSDGEIVAINGQIESGENISTACLFPDCYIMNLYDSDSDGWSFGGSIPNAGLVTVTTVSGTWAYNFQIGAEAQFGFGVLADDCELTILGCTDSTATNFNSNATSDDGSCIYPCASGMIEATLYVCTFDNGNEVAIEILDENNNIVYENDGFSDLEIMNTSLCLDPEMCYTVNMFNTVNTGWYGGYYWINVGGIEVSTGFPADNENFATADFSANGPCGDLILGCMNINACNYNSLANWSDQSCTYPGCMDSTALNFDSTAGCESGSCFYPEPCDETQVIVSSDSEFGANFYIYNELGEIVNLGDWSGNDIMAFCLQDGCYTFELGGQNWSQLYVATPSEVFNTQIVINNRTFINFGINATDCDLIIPGCDDPLAQNYDPIVTYNNGSCIYFDPVINDDCSTAISLSCGDIVTGTTLGAINETETNCGTTITSPGVWYSIIGEGSDINLSTCNQADFDTKISVFNGSCLDLSCVGGNDDTPGCEGFTTTLDFFAETGITYYILIHGFNISTGSFSLTALCSDIAPIYGCMDPEALNYNSEAEIDDGSCIFASCDLTVGQLHIDNGDLSVASWSITQDGNVIYEGIAQNWDEYLTDLCLADGCYELNFFGNTPINGEFELTIDDENIFSLPYYGNESFEFGINGTCSEIYGCTDPLASNYDPQATVDNGLCNYFQENCEALFAIYEIIEDENMIVVVNLSSPMTELEFLWDFGDGNTSTDEFPVHVYESDGTYNVCLTVTNWLENCTDTYCVDVTYDGQGYIIDGNDVVFSESMSGFTINIISPNDISINKNEDLSQLISIFPNPVKEVLTVRLKKPGQHNFSYQIIDLSGRVVQRSEKQLVNQEVKININNIANGTYLLVVENGVRISKEVFSVSK